MGCVAALSGVVSRLTNHSALEHRVKTREERLRLRSSTPRTRLDFVHTEGAKLLPDRNELLYRLPNHAVAAEIGVAEGEFTSEILKRNRPEKLFLIDPWGMDRYSAGMATVSEKFASEIKGGTVVIRQGTSLEALSTFDDGFFDWVYIDTDHSFELTWKELVLSNSKVNRGGRIAGHDFCTGNTVKPIVYGVVEAVNKFCAEYGWRFEYLTLDPDAHFSFCLQRL
jgi:predicted O-methyltransferase YrrM